jgi:large subunit ribosomal protein L5
MRMVNQYASLKNLGRKLSNGLRTKIKIKIKDKFQYKSVMQVPRLQKIAINQGVGAAATDKKLIDNAINEMTTITGQKAIPAKSKKDISNFKLRKGMPIGVRVTLRDNNMYEFLDRLIAVALPRIRDFKGINDKGFDGRGNYTLGVTEQIIFPEINIDQINKIMGMDITFVTTAKTDVEALELLKQFGLPFKNQTTIQQ